MIERKAKYKGTVHTVKLIDEMTGSIEAEYMNGFYKCLDTEVTEEKGKPKVKTSLRTADFNEYRIKTFDKLVVSIDNLTRTGKDGKSYEVTPNLNGSTFEQFEGAEKWQDLIPYKIKIAIMDEVYDQELLEIATLEQETKKKSVSS